MLEHVPEHLKTQKMCNEAVQSEPWMLEHVPEHLKTQEMCNEAVQSNPRTLRFVPEHLKTYEMCNEAVQSNPWMLELVSEHLKTQKMCNQALQSDPEVLEYVPDWFVTLQEMWVEDFDDDELFTGRDAYIKRKAQKAKIKEELMPVAWHPDRWWDWCIPEDEKQEISRLWS